MAPVRVIDTIKPDGIPLGQSSFPTVEDIDFLGGFQVQPTLVDMYAIPQENQKIGMLVYVIEDQNFYQLNSIGNSAGNWSIANFGESFTAGGDLSGSSISQEVIGLLHHSLPSLSAGYLNWDGSNWHFSALPSSLPPSGSAGGDLSSSYPNPTVARINGISVPLASSLATGQVLQYNGLEYVSTFVNSGITYVISSNDGYTGVALQSAVATASSNTIILAPSSVAPSGTVNDGISLFQSSDVGKSIQITGIGPNRSDLYTTIASYVNSTQITIAATATFSTPTHAPATAIWYPFGQDDTSNIQTAINNTTNTSSTVHLKAGVYVISSPLVSSQNLQSFIGDGLNQTYIVVNSASFAGDILSFSSTAHAFTIANLTLKHAGIATTSSALITSWSVSSNTATFTASNNYSAGQPIGISGFQNTGSPFNDIFAPVLASGLSSSQFEISFTPSTTISSASNGMSLPQSVINVASTNNFSGNYGTTGVLNVVSSNGIQTITYTGITANSFTGCSGGAGTLSTGNSVTAPLTGNTASLSASGSTVVLTGGFNFIPNVAFLSITISGSSGGLNDGTFTISAYDSATSTTYTNASAPAGNDANNGSISWVVDGYGTDNGVAHLDYNCVDFSLTNNTLIYADLDQVQMMRAPGNGLKCASAIVSRITGCVTLLNNSHGFAIYNYENIGSTSVVFDSCYANTNYEAGYYVHTINYSSFISTAADGSGISYYIFNGKNVSMTGCGSEASVNNNAAYPGWHYYIHGGQGNVLSGCYADCDSGTANLNGYFLVMDNQASQCTIQNMIFTGFSNQPAYAFYIHFSCFDNTIWEPYFASSNVITSWSGTAPTFTFNASNSYQAGQFILLTGFSSNATQFNNTIGFINSANSTSFTMNAFQVLNGNSFSPASGSGTDSGIARLGCLDIGTNDTIYFDAVYRTPVSFNEQVNYGIGPNYAQTGIFRGSPGGTQKIVTIRNTANTGDIELLGVTNSNSVVIGDGVINNNVNLNVPSGNLIQVQGAGTNALAVTVNPTGTTTIQTASTVTSTVINQAGTSIASAVGAPLTIQAQNATGTTATGGQIIITSGTGTTAAGSTVLQTGGVTRLTANASGIITISNLGTGIVHADSSGNLTSSAIINTDISASAAIAVNKLAAGTGAQVLLNNSTPSPTWTTISGDVSVSNTGSTSVLSLTGSSSAINIAATGNVLTWAAATTAPGLAQTTAASDVATANLTLTPQPPFASASTNPVGGNCIIALSTTITGNSRPYLQIKYGSTTEWYLGPLFSSGGATAGIYYGGSTPSASNYIVGANSTTTFINAGSGNTIGLQIAGTTVLGISSTGLGGSSGGSGIQITSTSIALSSTTPVTLSATQYAFGFIKFTGTISTGITIIFPSSTGAKWVVDTTAVVFSGNSITLQANSNSWGTVISAANSNTTDIFEIMYNGTKLYGHVLSP